jgi:hypothetical protein
MLKCHDWGNNTIIIQATNTIKTIHVTKKLGTLTKHPKVLVCYDFHSKIYDEEEDFMFVIEPRLFSIGTIVVATLVWLDQLVKLITSTNLNLVEQIYVPIEPIIVLPISSDIHFELVFILHVQIVIPLNTFKQHLL